jgi:hypothetical protein
MLGIFTLVTLSNATYRIAPARKWKSKGCTLQTCYYFFLILKQGHNIVMLIAGNVIAFTRIKKTLTAIHIR